MSSRFYVRRKDNKQNLMPALCKKQDLTLILFLILLLASTIALTAIPAVARAQVWPPSFVFSDLDGQNGFSVFGPSLGAEAGFSVAAAGDFNGDGLDDVVVGAHRAFGGFDNTLEEAGQALVVFGRPNSFPAVLDSASPSAGSLLSIQGSQTNGRAGFSVANAGDLNADGVDDLVVGAPFAFLTVQDPFTTVTDAGNAFIIYGDPDFTLSGVELIDSFDPSFGYRVYGESPTEYLGWSVSSAGDLNGDSVDDLLIGAPRARPGGLLEAGSVFVVFGSPSLTPESFAAADLDGVTGFRVDGDTEFDQIGDDVSALGDINADGFDDIGFCGGGNGGGGAGCWVLYGRDTSAAGNFAPAVSISDIDASSGFHISGSTNRIAKAGDLNADGVADLLVRGPGLPGDPLQFAGKVYAIFGNPAGFPAVFDALALDGTGGFRIEGDEEFLYLGDEFGAVGDANGDGIDDMLIGSQFASPNGAASPPAGSAFLLFGSSTPASAAFRIADIDGENGARLDGWENGEFAGLSASSAGDLNADGFADIVVGAYLADGNGRQDAGRGYIVFGGDSGPSTVIQPILTATPEFIDFGAVELGQTSAIETIQLLNSGNADLDISSVAILGEDAGDYSIISEDCVAPLITPGAWCNVAIDMTPMGIGSPRSAHLRVEYNSVQSPSTFALRGFGIGNVDVFAFVVSSLHYYSINVPDVNMLGNPIYRFGVANLSQYDISDVTFQFTHSDNISDLDWECQAGSVPQGCGGKTIGEGPFSVTVDLPAGEEMRFSRVTSPDGLNTIISEDANEGDVIWATAEIFLPEGATNVDASNSRCVDSDVIALMADGFERRDLYQNRFAVCPLH